MRRRLIQSLVAVTPLLSSPAVVLYAQAYGRWRSTANLPDDGSLEPRRDADPSKPVVQLEAEERDLARATAADKVPQSRREYFLSLLQQPTGDGRLIMQVLAQMRRERMPISSDIGSRAAYQLGVLGMTREMLHLVDQLRIREVFMAAMRAMCVRQDVAESRKLLSRLDDDGARSEARRLFLKTCARAADATEALAFVDRLGVEEIEPHHAQLVIEACLAAKDPATALAFAKRFGADRLHNGGRRGLLEAYVRAGRIDEADKLMQSDFLPHGSRTQAAFIAGLDDIDRAEAVLSQLRASGAEVADDVLQAVAKLNIREGRLRRAEQLAATAQTELRPIVRDLIRSYARKGMYEDASRCALLNGGRQENLELLLRVSRGPKQLEEAVEELHLRGYRPSPAAYNALAKEYSLAGNVDGIEKLKAEMRGRGLPVTSGVRRALVLALCRQRRVNEAIYHCGDDRVLLTEALILAGNFEDASEVLTGREWTPHVHAETCKLVQMASKAGNIRVAKTWWTKLRSTQVVPPPEVGQAYLTSLVRTGQYKLAVESYDDYSGAGGLPNLAMLQAIARAKVHSEDIGRVDELAKLVTELGPPTEQANRELDFQARLLAVFCDAGMVKEAEDAFRQAKAQFPTNTVHERFVRPMLILYANKDRREDMEDMWASMLRSGVPLSPAAVAAILAHVERSGDPDRAIRYAGVIRSQKTTLTEDDHLRLIDILIKHGRRKEAFEAWELMDAELPQFSNHSRVFHIVAPNVRDFGDKARTDAFVNNFRRRDPNTDWLEKM